MSLFLECKKLKRTALLATLLSGGILSAAFPVLNLLVRADSFVHLPNKPLIILFNGNWMMMAMMNSFLVVLCVCILYHIEFANNAMQRMDTLPVQPGKLFINKFILLVFAFMVIFIIEGAAFYFCTWKWFSITDGFLAETVKLMAYSFLLSMPMMSIMLVVSSLCENMWVTLGAGVIGIFAAQILNNAKWFKYFPFLMPYQSPLGNNIAIDSTMCIIAAAETILFLAAGVIFTKVRRNAA